MQNGKPERAPVDGAMTANIQEITNTCTRGDRKI